MSAPLHVEIRGTGPDLVLLHGWALHGGMWGPWLDELGRRARLHLIDLPGHGRSRWPDADRLVSQAHMHGFGISGRMDCNGFDSHFMRRAMDAKRNLAAIGDQDFFDAHVYAMTIRGWSYSTGCPLST